MEWTEALDQVVARTRHERYRALCADAHPDHAAYRRLVIELATGTPAEYPPLITQASSVVGAIGRAAAAILAGEPVLAPRDVVRARQALCLICPEYDACAARCRLCGCRTAAKQQLATELCPIGRWERHEASEETP